MSRQDSTRTDDARRRTLDYRAARTLKHSHTAERTLTRSAHARVEVR